MLVILSYSSLEPCHHLSPPFFLENCLAKLDKTSKNIYNASTTFIFNIFSSSSRRCWNVGSLDRLGLKNDVFASLWSDTFDSYSFRILARLDIMHPSALHRRRRSVLRQFRSYYRHEFYFQIEPERWHFSSHFQTALQKSGSIIKSRSYTPKWIPKW